VGLTLLFADVDVHVEVREFLAAEMLRTRWMPGSMKISRVLEIEDVRTTSAHAGAVGAHQRPIRPRAIAPCHGSQLEEDVVHDSGALVSV